MEQLFKIVITLFFMAGPLTCLPLFLALLKNFSPARQRFILVREGLISLVIALFFQYFGEVFLDLLHIQKYALSIGGGVIVMLVSIPMIFPKLEQKGEVVLKKEPFIVPIATPLLSGAGVLTFIMLMAGDPAIERITLTLGIALAWTAIVLVLLAGPTLQRLLGKRGLIALEQLMGMLLLMLGVQLLLKGLNLFYGTV